MRARVVLILTILGLAMAVSVAPVSAGGGPTTFAYVGPPVPIADGNDLSGTSPGAPATATVVAAGLVGQITDVDLKFDGSTCTASAGATTVGLDHTFISDLRIALTSPDGTTVELVVTSGGGGGNNLCQTVLDDEAASPFSSLTSGQAPFTGSFTPANPLSGFDGETGNGTWTLTVQDFFSQDTGNIRAFSVIVTVAGPPPSIFSKTDAPDPVVAGTNLTYTINVQNNETSAWTPVSVEDTVPTGTTFVSFSAPAGWTTFTPAAGGTGTVSATRPSLSSADGLQTFTLVVHVDASLAGGTILSNGASLCTETCVVFAQPTTVLSAPPPPTPVASNLPNAALPEPGPTSGPAALAIAALLIGAFGVLAVVSSRRAVSRR